MPPNANADLLSDLPRPKRWSANRLRRSVQFDIATERHKYDFDWELEGAYWYSRDELKSMRSVRLADAATLREALGINADTIDDADGLTAGSRDAFIGYKITNALDCVRDDDREVSLQGIEPFVFPVLMKEMCRRRRKLQCAVLRRSRYNRRRGLDPEGIDLAEESAKRSEWARDVASERGIKYCEMKRGRGGLLQATKCVGARRNFSICEKIDREFGRATLIGAIDNDVMLNDVGYAGRSGQAL